MTLDMEDPQIDQGYEPQMVQPPPNVNGDSQQDRPLLFAGEEGFSGGVDSRSNIETLQIKPAEALRNYDEMNHSNPPGITLNPTKALETPQLPENDDFLHNPQGQSDTYFPLKPANRHKNSLLEDTYDYMGYDDKFPCDSQGISKMLAVTIPMSSFFIAVAYFITLFEGVLTYGKFWNVFIFVAVHVMIIVAGFKAKSFLKWCFKNCRIIIRRHYILFLQAITVQCFSFYFAKDIPILLVGSSFVLFASLFILIGLIVWVVGAIRHR